MYNFARNSRNNHNGWLKSQTTLWETFLVTLQKLYPKLRETTSQQINEEIPQLIHRNQINNQKTQCCLINAFVIGGLKFRRHYGFPQILPFTIFKERNWSIVETLAPIAQLCNRCRKKFREVQYQTQRIQIQFYAGEILNISSKVWWIGKP